MIGVMKEPIDYQALDEKPVRFVFLLLLALNNLRVCILRHSLDWDDSWERRTFLHFSLRATVLRNSTRR